MRTVTRVFLLLWTCAANGMPKATVTAANPALGVRRQAVTTDDGAFDIAGLPPGAGYKLKVERKNFANWESKEFEVVVRQTRISASSAISRGR